MVGAARHPCLLVFFLFTTPQPEVAESQLKATD